MLHRISMEVQTGRARLAGNSWNPPGKPSGGVGIGRRRAEWGSIGQPTECFRAGVLSGGIGQHRAASGSFGQLRAEAARTGIQLLGM